MDALYFFINILQLMSKIEVQFAIDALKSIASRGKPEIRTKQLSLVPEESYLSGKTTLTRIECEPGAVQTNVTLSESETSLAERVSDTEKSSLMQSFRGYV